MNVLPFSRNITTETKMLTLHARPDSSNSAKIFWFMEEAGIDHQLILTGRGYADASAPEFLKLNPFGKVPVIEENGETYWESNAILRYLARRYAAPTFWPDDIGVQAQIDGWMDWASLSLTPPLTRYRKAGASVDLQSTVAVFSQLDQALSQNDFIAGGALTLVDFSAAPAVRRWFLLSERPDLPHLAAYEARLSGFPGYCRHIRDNIS